jgi:hypothetical protein
MRRKYHYELTAKAHLALSEEQKCPVCGKRMIEGVNMDGRVFSQCVRRWGHPPVITEPTVNELVDLGYEIEDF